MERQRLDGVGSILRALRGAGRLTRQELAQACGMGRSQLLQHLDVLRELGIVEERLTTSSTGGRRPRAASIRPGQGHVLVAALGVTGVTVAAVDLSGRIVDTRQSNLEIALGPERVLTECVRLLTDLTQENGLGPSWGMGISVPGPLDHRRGMVVSPPAMPGWDQFPIRDWLSERLGTACWLDNDVHVMAVGEQPSVSLSSCPPCCEGSNPHEHDRNPGLLAGHPPAGHPRTGPDLRFGDRAARRDHARQRR
jgi:DNA-binding transcriptional ArsR family regulator